MSRALLQGMRSLPPRDAAEAPASSLDVSLIIPARNAGHALENTVRTAHAFFTRRSPETFEIILVPNPAAQNDESLELAEALCKQYTHLRSVPHVGTHARQGKGAAVRTGVFASRGKLILFTDADLPYDLDFFDEAIARLKSGTGMVSGNRRLDESHFNIPVNLLQLAYGRHRLGLAFNSAMRWLLPIETTDTQAGIKALSRDLALLAFSKLACPGFFFDLELFLTAAGHGFLAVEAPVALRLNNEKSTVRILRDSILAGYWLLRLFWREIRGRYRPARLQILSRYAGIPLGTRLFLALRWGLTPYRKMSAYLPRQGRILDLGCGHGLFALASAALSSGRDVVGVDHDVVRVNYAKRAAFGYANLKFRTGDALGEGTEAFDAISLVDVMHYLSAEEQALMFRRAAERLRPGGRLIFREVDPRAGLVSRCNRLYERIATGIGFTHSNRKTSLHFRTQSDWLSLLKSAGYEETQALPCSHFLFADVLFVGRKPEKTERTLA